MKNFHIKDLIYISAIIIILVFSFKSCKNRGIEKLQKKVALVQDRNSQLNQLNNEINVKYTSDSTKYYKAISNLNKQLGVLSDSKDLLKRKYYKAVNSIRDTFYIDNIVQIGGELIRKQDSIIEVMRFYIVQDSIFILNQNNVIISKNEILSKKDSLINYSIGVMKSMTDRLSKSDKKLKRTRKIGIAGFFSGVILGGVIGVAVK